MRPKTVYILDNAAIHNNDLVKTYFSNRKIMCLTLPPYTPWFNPIESVFGITKNWLR